MIWLLSISVVLNILLALVIAGLTFSKVSSDIAAEFSREQWMKWEGRFYEAQGILIEKYKLYIFTTKGAYGKMLIEDRSKEEK